MATAHQHRPRIGPLRTLHFGGDGGGVVPSHVVPHADKQPAKNVDVRGRGLGHRIRQRVNLERRQHKNRRKRSRQRKKQPQRSRRDDLHSHDIKDCASDHDAERDGHTAMVLLKPGKHPREIRHKQRGVNGHVENGRYQREPSFLKSPEISHGAAHPGVIAAFKGQRARKLADHKRGRQAPENRGEQQNENRFAISGAMHDVFGPIGSARDHKEGRGDQGPKRETDGFLPGGGKRRLRNVSGCGSCCQFLWLPPQATHSHHRVSLENAARGSRASCEFPGHFGEVSSHL